MEIFLAIVSVFALQLGICLFGFFQKKIGSGAWAVRS